MRCIDCFDVCVRGDTGGTGQWRGIMEGDIGLWRSTGSVVGVGRVCLARWSLVRCGVVRDVSS